MQRVAIQYLCVVHSKVKKANLITIEVNTLSKILYKSKRVHNKDLNNGD